MTGQQTEAAPAVAANGSAADGSGETTFTGRDPGRVAAQAICRSTPTKCQARNRLYRRGELVAEGFPVAEISDYLADAESVVWLDLRDPDREDLTVLSEEFGLHPVAVEDAIASTSGPSWTGIAVTCS